MRLSLGFLLLLETSHSLLFLPRFVFRMDVDSGRVGAAGRRG